VRSVYGGKVAYAGWLKGYGQLLIIDHGGGFFTLFARLQKILKDKGDIVEKGADIALVGDTGVDASAGLYFEIREKGVPRDPMAWLASGH
ncbi:MAG: peptidoglycan DD-metalloendopeptidase family protein, partial [Deltaproteobacteria bacterium]|nr:peptidoglycan DD-metalloendopeptidase family protein [Deltaproteobacteria bacterium]